MFGLQPIHLVLILIIALVIFGPQRLPELGKSLGKSITEFKQATKEVKEPFTEATGSGTSTGRTERGASDNNPQDK
jgi:sec-independent protein translocase protein TatA